MSTITRFGNLARVFKDGDSELLNGIARLSVLYEDLRLEIEELRVSHGKGDENRDPGDEYRVIYFLRRALVTLTEFRSGLTTIRMTREFKLAQGHLQADDSRYIAQADKYLQQHGPKIKELRDALGGHVLLPGIEFATRHFSDVIGRVTWNRAPDGWAMGLECDFAGQVVAGAISSKLQADTDVRTELTIALGIISEGFIHAQAAMLALVHAFLWDRFG